MFYLAHLEISLNIGSDSKSSFMLFHMNSGFLLSCSNPTRDESENPKAGKTYAIKINR